jgi:hypothetical protein
MSWDRHVHGPCQQDVDLHTVVITPAAVPAPGAPVAAAVRVHIAYESRARGRRTRDSRPRGNLGHSAEGPPHAHRRRVTDPGADSEGTNSFEDHCTLRGFLSPGLAGKFGVRCRRHCTTRRVIGIRPLRKRLFLTPALPAA